MHVPHGVIRPHRATLVASAKIPTRHGQFDTYVFHDRVDGEDMKEHVALVYGDIRGKEDVPVRIHSECMTSEVFGSLKCDCKDQLEAALAEIARRGAGAVLYLRQEGRGIGLLNKIRAYSLQDRGLDTVDANLALGFRDDEREYSIAAHMLHSLKVRSIRLLTNNPRKVNDLSALGVKVAGRQPHVIPPNEHNRFYLETKASRSGHYLDFSGKPHLAEQGDPVQVEGMGA